MFAPYHLSKATALSNVSRVKAASAACVHTYEACLKSQQAHVARRRKLVRQGNMEGVPHQQLSVAERKKLLWDSSGKLATGSSPSGKQHTTPPLHMADVT